MHTHTQIRVHRHTYNNTYFMRNRLLKVTHFKQTSRHLEEVRALQQKQSEYTNKEILTTWDVVHVS